MYELFLSFRFLQRHWLMTLIGSFFVGASLVVLVVVMAVMDGFQERLKESFAGSSADLIVTPRYEADLDLLDAEVQAVLGERVVATAPHMETISMVRRAGRVDNAVQDEFQVAQVFGVDGVREQRINRFSDYLRSPKGPDYLPTVADLNDPFAVSEEEEALGFAGVILGKTLRRNLDVGTGQKIKLFALVPTRSDGTGSANSDDFELREELFIVVGTYESLNTDIDARAVYLDQREFRRFFNETSTRQSIRAKLAEPDDHKGARDALHGDWLSIAEASLRRGETLPPWLRSPTARAEYAFHVQPWWYRYETIVKAIESEKAMILVIAFLIVVSGTSSIFAAQWLLVSDKIREIGILRALGASVRGVATVFILNGFLMGVLGSVGGTALGILCVEKIDLIHSGISALFGRKVFDENVYKFEQIPTLLDVRQIVQFAAAALVCTLLAALIPALRAGLMDPAKALHNE